MDSVVSLDRVKDIVLEFVARVETTLWTALPPEAQQHARSFLFEVCRSLGVRVETALLLAVVAIAVALISSLIALRLAFSSPRPTTIVLLGLPGAGKTSLWYKLRDGSTHSGTVTSMAVNEDSFPLHAELSKNPKARPIHMVDIPGHPRVRSLCAPFLARARGLVFLVDAMDFTLNIRPNAEFLFELLTSASVQRRRVPILLVCNKMERVTAHSVEFIRKQLEKELEKLRVSRQAMASDGMAKEAPLSLALKGTGVFRFTDCVNSITLGECSVVTDNLNDVETFIRDLVRP